MGHTPGPWKASGTKALGFSEVLAPNAEQRDGFYVATVNRTYFSGPLSVQCNIPREVTDANARLIAAAPLLLDACRAAIRVGFWGHHPDTLDSDEVVQVVEQIHAAIKAAIGGEA